MVLVLSYLLLFSVNVLVRSDLTLEGHDPECSIDDEPSFDFDDCHDTLANEYYCTLSQKQQEWLTSLWREALQDRSNPPRIRREIRVLNDRERLNYLRANEALKNDKVCILQSLFVLKFYYIN